MTRMGSFVAAMLLFSVGACFAQPQPPQPPRPGKFLNLEGPSLSFLGVGVAEIDSERAKELKLKEERGVEVKSVEDESPAAKAGVKVGDVVLDYQGQRVEGAEQFVRLVRETPVGRQVKLLLSRNGTTQTVAPTIGSRTAVAYFSKEMGNLGNELRNWEKEMKGYQMPDLPRPMVTMQSRALGVESEALGSQLAEYFGVKEGVLVRSVARGSAAEKAGIKAGDVITKVGDRRVSSPREISGALRSISGKNVPVTITRNQKEMTVNVTLDERSSGERRRPVRLTL